MKVQLEKLNENDWGTSSLIACKFLERTNNSTGKK
jgi:hypothetical protein